MAESAREPSCGCKGIRSCLTCEESGSPKLQVRKKYQLTYDRRSGFAVGGEFCGFSKWALPFPGVYLLDNFVSEEEETQLVDMMDRDEWKSSQSGRKKQDYGPKVNFKKRKLKTGCFNGLPSFSHQLVNRMLKCPVLKDFLPVEQCNLDYRPERGSSIDPHFDDWWLWGERLVSVNLLADTTLSMSRDSDNYIQLHPSGQMCNTQSPAPVTDQSERTFHFNGDNLPVHCTGDCRVERTSEAGQRLTCYSDVEVAIHVPRRSLVVLYGEARYKWKHAIHRESIKSRRICSTFRELSEEFSQGGKQEALGKQFLDIALSFQGNPV
ncbi:alpha-ketoglutarate-dependent dioxygenase alkB homolog 4 [Callorhinchus milii]|uniref:AlkB homolog 4, lysine demthylase n=1 Tax=Callorhinchus milii TaxID=7868 RepID=A0A4W3IEB5_CALMI|nr:alpha-ketoglutarate-dependent dioxygenase alkB homolog 4 [Callorhinchus milii]|eukprot:gi/632957736/ref/XP_007894648.1/ PREDICTED: alpha-ketoglutarate-dependent dioxygenase alkB homolog 4 [Callorhinchus milii]